VEARVARVKGRGWWNLQQLMFKPLRLKDSFEDGGVGTPSIFSWSAAGILIFSENRSSQVVKSSRQHPESLTARTLWTSKTPAPDYAYLSRIQYGIFWFFSEAANAIHHSAFEELNSGRWLKQPICLMSLHHIQDAAWGTRVAL